MNNTETEHITVSVEEFLRYYEKQRDLVTQIVAAANECLDQVFRGKPDTIDAVCTALGKKFWSYVPCGRKFDDRRRAVILYEELRGKVAILLCQNPTRVSERYCEIVIACLDGACFYQTEVPSKEIILELQKLFDPAILLERIKTVLFL